MDSISQAEIQDLFRSISFESNPDVLTEFDVSTNGHLFKLGEQEQTDLLRKLILAFGVDQPTYDLFLKFAQRNLNMG